MVRQSIPILLLMALLGAVSPAVHAKELLSEGARVEVSNQPNPIWSKDKLNDGKESPTSGWLCSRQDGCWVELTLDGKVPIDEIWVRQASFPQTGNNRYARPKVLQLTFDGGGAMGFELQDKEDAFQKITFDPVLASAVRITVESYFENASVPELAGFQEIKIFKSDKPSGMAPRPSGGNTSSAGQLDDREKKILLLLNQLMAELEDYFMEN